VTVLAPDLQQEVHCVWKQEKVSDVKYTCTQVTFLYQQCQNNAEL